MSGKSKSRKSAVQNCSVKSCSGYPEFPLKLDCGHVICGPPYNQIDVENRLRLEEKGRCPDHIHCQSLLEEIEKTFEQVEEKIERFNKAKNKIGDKKKGEAKQTTEKRLHYQKGIDRLTQAKKMLDRKDDFLISPSKLQRLKQILSEEGKFQLFFFDSRFFHES